VSPFVLATPKKKSKTQQSNGKAMMPVLSEAAVVLIDFLCKATTIELDVHIDTVQKLTRRGGTCPNSSSDMTSARHHTSIKTHRLLWLTGRQLHIPHLISRPNLVLSGFYLVLKQS